MSETKENRDRGGRKKLGVFSGGDLTGTSPVSPTTDFSVVCFTVNEAFDMTDLVIDCVS